MADPSSDGSARSGQAGPSASLPERSSDNTVVAGKVDRLLRCLATYRMEPLVLLFTLATTLMLASAQNLIMDRVCIVNLAFNSSVCENITHPAFVHQESAVQRLANQYVLYKNIIETVPGVVFALFMGSWSDAHGRKLPLLLPIAGSTLSCLVFIVFSVADTLPAQFVLFAAVPSALTGGGTVFLMAAFSYVGDITGPRDRTSRLAVLDVCFLAPLALGFVTSGTLVTNVGYLALYGISGGLTLLVLLYGVFLVPESRSAAERARASTGAAVSKQAMKRVVFTCFRRRHGFNRCSILLAMFGFIVHMMTFSGESEIVLPYVKRTLGWSFQAYSNYVTILLLVAIFYNLVVMPLLSYVLRLKDSVIGLGCELLRIAGLIMRGMVSTTELYYGAAMIGVPGSLVSVTLRSIISKSVPKEELGVVFSFQAALESACSLVASSAFLLLYNSVVESGPGVIWYIGAAMTSPAAIVLVVLVFLELRGAMGYAQVVSEQEEEESRGEADAVSDDTSIFQTD